MALADALQHQRARGVRKGPDCRMCVLESTLPKGDLAALLEAMADPNLTGTQISRALRAEGYDISAVVVLRHRKRECQRR
jgi:hypothetical protein